MNKRDSEHLSLIENIYLRMSDWLDDVQRHELTQIVDVVEKTKQYALAAEALPEEKIKQFVDNFTYDLNQFYLLNQQQALHSLYLGVMNETFWQLLAKMTDQAQVEWAELPDDFDHDGQYSTGDVIGFGELKCNHCDARISISHLSEVGQCLECGQGEFTRLPYAVK